jgi:hypothetical protein
MYIWIHDETRNAGIVATRPAARQDMEVHRIGRIDDLSGVPIDDLLAEIRLRAHVDEGLESTLAYDTDGKAGKMEGDPHLLDDVERHIDPAARNRPRRDPGVEGVIHN